jgi:imidazolonepropionase-like amidohydrolase
MHLLEGGQIADADGTLEADVAIENGHIGAVGDVPESDVDERTDVSGKFVVPGLIDTHVHLMMDGRPNAETVQGDTEAAYAYRTADNLRKALEAGVTTIRDPGSGNGATRVRRLASPDGVKPL